jgi:A/G-specific adenine glycosylase
MALHGGQFPSTSEQLQTLPGIGPSTAAAIASFCFAERVAILDGNVKRVLTRLLAFDGDMAEGAAVRELQTIADNLLPEKNLTQNMPRYTQGLMDLGATLCTRSKPACPSCPVRDICLGFADGRPEQYPVKTKKLKRSSQQMRLLLAQKSDGSVWLERRPVSGIWGGLYCLPVFDTEDDLNSFVPQSVQAQLAFVKPFVHVLTHKDLHLHPVIALFPMLQKSPAREPSLMVAEPQNLGAWFRSEAWEKLGLPSPIRKLLQAATATATANATATATAVGD